MDIAFEIEGLRFDIDGKSILQGIDLLIEKGEFLAVIGPNGSGKTTLLKCLDMLNTEWSGCILLDNNDLHSFSHKELAKRIAYIPQQLGDLPSYSVRKFVELSRYAWDGDNGAVERALKDVGMLDFTERRLGSLSGGELQKVSIASALAQETEIILLDEPTAFLDPKFSQQIWRLLKQINANRKCTIVAVTHDINSAAAFADRICGLKEGKVFALHTPSDFMKRSILNPLFDADFVISDNPRRVWLS